MQDVRITNPPASHLNNPFGWSTMVGAYLERYKAKKKRKIKVGL
jgi:hypothetical protein